MGLGAIGALPVAFFVLGYWAFVGRSPTGYAINPARDLGPRIMHFILPIGKKRDSDWGYAWIPVLGPIAGAIARCAGLYCDETLSSVNRFQYDAAGPADLLFGDHQRRRNP